MKIIELNESDFNSFAISHPLRNYCQTSAFARAMEEKGFTHDYIGYTDDSNNLVGASLILKKKIGMSKFIYAPKGVLVDYLNTELVKKFIKDICNHYKKRAYSFFKINPEIIIAELDKNNNYSANYNQNVQIIDVLKDIGFKRRREIYPLDQIYPRINAFIDLKNYNPSEELEKKIDIARNNGITIEEMGTNDIKILLDEIGNKINDKENFCRGLINNFMENANYYIIKINYEQCLLNAQKRYEEELNNNNYYNNLLQSNNTEENIDKKMQSDKDLLKYKNEVVNATNGLKSGKIQYAGGAIVVKYENRVSIVVDGFKNFDLYADYFLYDYLITKYKDTTIDYIDLHGISSKITFDEENLFNKAKLDFNPVLYEFIGEFDIIINELLFKKLQSKGYLSKEFLPSHNFETYE